MNDISLSSNNHSQESKMNIPKYIAACRVSLPGIFLYHCMIRRRKIALENINLVFGETLTTHEKKRLAKAFFTNLCLMIKEIFLCYFIKSYHPTIEIEGIEYLQEAIQKDRGVIVLVPHSGNWELINLSAQNKIPEVRNNLYVLRKQQKNKIQKIINTMYGKVGLHIIAQGGAFQKMALALINKAVLIFIFDQHVSVENNKGIAVEFFGVKAGCARAVPELAKMTGAIVVPGYVFRPKLNHHVLKFYPPMPSLPTETRGHEENELYQNILQYNRILEQMILEHPEQWFGWIHRRWKLHQSS